MSSTSHPRHPAESPQDESISSDADHAPELTQAEQERAMAALESVKAGRVMSAEDVRRRVQALLQPATVAAPHDDSLPRALK